MSSNPELALQIAQEIRESGNKLFKEGNAAAALAKYQSKYLIANNEYAITDCYLTQESIRYLDIHPILPDDAPPELTDSYKALLSPLLLNSALAAVRAQPPSPLHAETAVKSATRVLDALELNNADKGNFTKFLFTTSLWVLTD